MKIVNIKTTRISVPLVAGRTTLSSRGRHERSPFLIAEVETDIGLVGVGEASCTPGWSGEDSKTAQHVITTYLSPLLIGEDPLQIEALTARLNKAIFGNYFAKAAIDIALWDLAAKFHEAPLYYLWGGPMRSEIKTKFGVPGFDPAEAANLADWALGIGFSAFKVKVGRDIGTDDRVIAVREAIGEGSLLGVDANGGWTLSEAIGAVHRLTVSSNIAFVEQPLAPWRLLDMSKLRRELGIPLVADESVGTPEEAAAVVSARAADVLDIYVGMAGGLTAARRIAHLAFTMGLGWTLGSNRELGIGTAAQLHLALAAPGLDDSVVPCDINSPFYYEADIIEKPLPIVPGSAEAPVGPGLGVTLDREAIMHYEERS